MFPGSSIVCCPRLEKGLLNIVVKFCCDLRRTKKSMAEEKWSGKAAKLGLLVLLFASVLTTVQSSAQHHSNALVTITAEGKTPF